MGVSFLSFISRLQRSLFSREIHTWAVGPGFYIPRLWRLQIVDDSRKEGWVRIIASRSSSLGRPATIFLAAATPTQTSRHTAALQSANRIDRADGRPSRPRRR